MGADAPASRSNWGLVATVLVAAFLAAVAYSAVTPSSALACAPATHPDGSKTCSQFVISDPCPTATGVGNATTGYFVEYIPTGATVIGHTLNFSPNPPCENATAVEISFEDPATGTNPDTTSLNPPPGQKAVRVIYRITCTSTPCGGTSPISSFSVTYTEPSTSEMSRLIACHYAQEQAKHAKTLPKQVEVKCDRTPNTHPIDLTALILVYSGVYPIRPRALELPFEANPFAAKQVKAGTLGDVRLADGQDTAVVPIHLNGKARKALSAVGKLTFHVKGTLTGATGDPGGTLKLTAPKS